MVEFEALFIASRGEPIEYDGRWLHMADRYPVDSGARLRLIRETFKTSWRQGIHLSTDGQFDINGQTIPRAMVLWADTAPADLIFDIRSRTGFCTVKNVWDTGDGTMHSWHAGGAMIVEEIERGRRYRCNDGHFNDDFDDIVFRLEPVCGVGD